MEILSHPIIAVVLLLGILVIVHEAGHFFAGKFCKIPVEVFSIGFGPVLFNKKIGETDYRVSLIPLGGFVKFYGSIPSEEVPDELKGREFFRASIKARLFTVAAGPIANLILSIIVFSSMVMFGIQQPPPIIGEILPGSPAEKAGIRFGDKVTKIDDNPVTSWKDVQRIISDSPKKSLTFKIERDSKVLDLVLVPESVRDEDLPGQRGRVGISRVMVPAVVSVENPQGLFAKAGVLTGQRFVHAEWNNSKTEIKYWRQFLSLLEKVSEESKSRNQEIKVSFLLRNWDPTKGAQDEGKNTGDLAPVQKVEVVFPASWNFKVENISTELGIVSGELAVYEVEEPVRGLRRGDLIRAWNKQPVQNAFDMSTRLGSYIEPKAAIQVLRDGKLEEISVDLKPIELQKAEGKVTQYTLPVIFWGSLEQPEWILEQYKNPFLALRFGISETWDMTKSIGRAISGLFTGEMPLTTLGGPIAIAKVASDSVRIGWQAFLSALALISINLALLNLVPIPILDGGQLVLISVEGLMRKPVPEVAIENYQKIGFIMVLALFVIATYNDVGRFWASLVKGISSRF